MAERLLVYSAEQRDLVTEYGGLLVQVDLANGGTAHYSVDNIFALEEWTRFDPSNTDWKRAKINVLGTFGSLTELRETYLADLALKNIFDENRHAEDVERVSDQELYRSEVQGNEPLVSAVQGTVIGFFDEVMKSSGVSIAQTDEVVSTVRTLADGDDYKGKIIETRTKEAEQVLWLFFYAETSAFLLPALVDYYEECLEAPYTVLIDQQDLDLYINSPYRSPRIKMSQAVIKGAIADLLEDIDRYNKSNLWLDGQKLFEEEDIVKAKQIIADN